MKKAKKKFVIIDGNAIIHRAYHALPPLTARDGTMVNAVFGFTSMLLKVLNDVKPEYLALSFDVAGGTFRDEVYEDYKATRVKADDELYNQIPLVHKMVEAFDIPIYTKEGYEADDVIGTLVKKMEKEKGGIENIVVTGDMDILQLVDKKTKVFGLRKGMSDIVMYGEGEVKEKYGFGPERVVDYKALRGDPSDNIPGVKGIGEKTAKQLIGSIGGVKEIYKDLKAKKSKIREQFKSGVVTKLEQGEKDAMMSQELATIVCNVPGVKFKLEDCAVHEFDVKKLTDLFRKFEFYSLVKRLPGNKEAQKIEKKTNQLINIENEKGVGRLIKQIDKTKVFVCKEVLSGKEAFSDFLGLVFVVGDQSYFVEPKISKKLVKQVFTNKEYKLIGHNLKQLVKVVSLQGVEVQNKLFDIMIASYLLNSSTKAHDSKSIVLRELGEELPSGSDQGSLFGSDPELLAREMELIQQVQKKQEKKMADLDDKGLFEKVEMNLIPVLAEMELNGVAVDVKMLNKLSKEVAQAIDRVVKKIWKQAGQEFNVASSVQLREILFTKLDLPTEGIKKGKTGYSTSASELEKLRDIHPIISMIEEHRELAKLQNTYVDVLPKLVDKKTKRIHANFNQAVTTTGRLSSSDPNLQNIPIRSEIGKEIRRAFIAEPGHTLVAADYSQIELRIVASLAKDKKMLEVFKKKEDIHKATAAIINGVPLDKVTKEMRYAAKEVNFGVLYGMGAYGLSWRTKITKWQAKEFIEKYFEQFDGVKKYIDQTVKFAKKEGYVETLFGRRRYVPELRSSNFQLRAAGERMAINMPIQGTAADLMKMAMIQVRNEIRKLKPAEQKQIRMTLQVHDEIVVEVKNGLEKKVSNLVKQAMENVVKLRVPVETHVSIGKRWGDLK